MGLVSGLWEEALRPGGEGKRRGGRGERGGGESGGDRGGGDRGRGEGGSEISMI